MKYCIIPDVHGRTFWIGLKNDIDKYDRIIFLGDYLDPYVGYDGITQEEAFENFKDLIEFAKEHKDKVRLLLGNHDLHYFPNVSVRYGCRRDNVRYKDIQKLFLENISLFRLCDILNSKMYGKVFLSHAGINMKWLKNIAPFGVGGGVAIDETVNNINKMTISEKDLNNYVWTISWLRGGNDAAGSFIWSDLEEHNEMETRDVNNELGVDYQIFAHTYAYPSPDDIYECSSYAMIDNKKAFEIE